MLTKEELKNTFIKYTPEITEKMFNKILQIAKEFQEQIHYDKKPYDFVSNTFENFAENKYFWFGPKGTYIYGVDNNSQGNTEIQISDILGENWSNSKKLPFKIGDKVTISAQPSSWSSLFNQKCGLDKVPYPHTFVVKDIKKSKGYIAISDGIYGWVYCPKLFKKIESKEWWKDLKEGDYVVALEDSPYPSEISQPRHFLKNFIYKIYNNNNSEANICYTREDETYGGAKALYFRTATQEEVKLYEHAGKPVDVTTYKILVIEDKSVELQPEDLVEGEIYFYTFKGYCNHISMYSGKYTSKYDLSFNHINRGKPNFRINTTWNSSATDGTLIKDSLRLATPEEKQWLNVCIAEGKFIEREIALRDYDMDGKALKSEVIPEYVKCIDYRGTDDEYIIGKIYKVKEKKVRTNSGYLGARTLPSNLLNHYGNTDFKPSTKEAYEAQFKKEKDVKKEQAIIIENKEQWDYALNIIRKGKNLYSYISNNCLDTDDGCYCSKEYYEREGYEIISFEKWCEQENIVNPLKKEIKEAKEVKDVKGKWFLWTTFPKSTPDGLKYVKGNYIREESLFYSERIDVDGRYYKTNQACVWDDELEEVSILEIQEYLPEGHPDKIKSEMKQSELKVGKWYTCIDVPNSIICNQGNNKGYGMWDYYWNFSPDAWNIGTNSNWRELSDKEVEERLIKYAKEHYPVGTTFKSALIPSNTEYEVQTNNYFMWHGLDGVVVNSSFGPSIYDKGKWADIISKPKVKSEEPPCKVGDYIYLIDATKEGDRPEYAEYNKNILKVTRIYKGEGNKEYNGWWIECTPRDFGGGGFRINGNGWQWNKHIRLATDAEIHRFKFEWTLPKFEDFPKYVKEHSQTFENVVYTGGGILDALKEKPKLKLKSNKKVIISKKQVKVSNKHLI